MYSYIHNVATTLSILGRGTTHLGQFHLGVRVGLGVYLVVGVQRSVDDEHLELLELSVVGQLL